MKQFYAKVLCFLIVVLVILNLYRKHYPPKIGLKHWLPVLPLRIFSLGKTQMRKGPERGPLISA